MGVLAGCEGKQGPVGPPGPSATFNLILIEKTFSEDDYDEELSSFYLHDPRINPKTVTNIFVKRFYTNTGDEYYIPISSLGLGNSPVFTQVMDGRVRFFDVDKVLALEIVAVSVIK
tara:strand:- start:55 stop:402 length:348 start_codon:yes stop_codon:yes gene_type:complete